MLFKDAVWRCRLKMLFKDAVWKCCLKMLLKDVLSGKLPAPAAGKPDKLRAVGTQNLKTPASRALASPQAQPTAAAAPHEAAHPHSEPQSSESMSAPPPYPPPDVEAGLDGSAVPGSPSPKFTAIGAATLAPRLCRVVSCRAVSCRFGAGFLLCDL